MLRLLLLFCLCHAFFSVQSQHLTLQQSVDIALKNSLDIRIERNNLKISQISDNKAMAGAYPTVTSVVSNQESANNLNQELNTGTKITRNGNLTNSLNANLTSSIVLYSGGRINTTAKRLKELVKLSEQQLNTEIQSLIAEVMLQYYDIIRLQELIKSTQSSIGVSEKTLEITESKKSIGLANDLDLLQSKIDLNQRKQLLQSQKSEVRLATIKFLNTLNLPTDTLININDSIVINENLKLSELSEKMNQNPMIKGSEIQIKINSLVAKELNTLNKPTLSAGAGFNFGRLQNKAGQLLFNQTYGPFIGVNLTLPIFNGYVVKKQLQVANINTDNSKLTYEAALRNTQSDLAYFFETYHSAIERMKIQSVNNKLSLELTNLKLEQYRLGAANAIEIREAQKNLDESNFQTISLKYLTKISEIRLLHLSGQLQ